MHWLYYLLLAATMLAGLWINLLGLPGLWLMVLALLVFAWGTGWVYVAVGTVIVVAGLAVAAEIVEFVAGGAGAAAAGGSKRGMAGAIAGGLLGGLVGSVLLPVPVVGTILGALAGTFVGAVAVERGIGRSSGQSLRIGMGAAKGRLWAIVGKSLIGVLMALIGLIAAFPL